ncbi:MAG: TonB-dependent receptor [Gemmatimonadales bacterium]
MPATSTLRFAFAALTFAAPALAAQERPRTLDTLVAVASRASAGGAVRSVTIISRDDVARSSARNVAELLSFQLGIDVYGRSAAQADISLRGSTAEQTLVLVDGIRMSDAQSSHYALDLGVPLASIERIEILRGAGSALYGSDAIGGVINIVTRRGAPSPAGHARGGSFGTYGAGLAGGTNLGRTALTSAAEYEQSNGYRAGTDYRIGQARLSASTKAGQGQLEGNVAVGIRDFGANAFYAPYNSSERTGTFTADARWRTLAGGWSIATTASTRRHTDRFTLVKENPALYQNEHTNWLNTGEIVARTAFGAATVALGAEASRTTLTSNRLGDRAESRGALFAEAAVNPTLSSVISFGIRGDRTSTFGGFLSPSVGVALPLAEGLQLHGSAGRGFRAPSWTERYYSDPTSVGNADLVPEKFWSGDLGVRLGNDGPAAFDLTGFVRKADNLIDWVKEANGPSGAPWVATNVGEAHYRGLEASFSYPLSATVDAAVSGSLLHFEDSQGAGLIGKYALRPITRRATAHLSYAPKGTVRTSIELVGARRATEAGYLTGNARVEWRPGRIGFTIDLTNLGNAEWLDASGQVVAGRGLYLGATLQ